MARVAQAGAGCASAGRCRARGCEEMWVCSARARARGKAVKNRRYRCIYGFVFVCELCFTGWQAGGLSGSGLFVEGLLRGSRHLTGIRIISRMP